MKWLRRIAWRISKRAWEDNEEFQQEEKVKARATLRQARANRGQGIPDVWATVASDDVKEHDSPRAQSMNFRLYTCVGGHILESSSYNRRTDTNEHTLYMIHEDQDFAKQVAQSIMLEQMKQ
jgi:hypothetical protein